MYPEMIETIRELTANGIVFCAASGRQYESIRNVFAEVGDDIAYISENGAQIKYAGQDILLTCMERSFVEDIILELREYYSTCDVIVSTPEGSLIESRNRSFIDLMTFGYRNKFRLVDDILAEPVAITKISIYCEEGMRTLGETVLIPRWQDRVKVCMAGEEWLDFMDQTVDKGNALMALQDFLGIAREETMAFGDNNNDIGLLRAAGTAVAVENARDEVKAVARFSCPSYLDKGVYQFIKQNV
jgi:Cof subfamily protein (haloacid dehalogenase superfamily)